ncbi:PQQ-like beta-propeller repeat protein [Limimaricola pyoseonensis]|uniref:Outer membrane protein assembly factor BamB, contains PQQ-like beta-propeller repeat n=1 Tax=Limimaricola pyoseonensis TaxID=521013 RepID=A0A1G6ZS55_9RHOB|nr:PQQ-like beta-propeller repeat protein [Limimaricola pyoseonensis]SDE05223.1 Outer membrane protein assembly factor BamB, contains PQQ-like beta-propeller repeat [Limimaricola pyoseonensis]
MRSSALIGLGAVALLAACGEPDVRLPGDRIGVAMPGAALPAADRDRPLALAQPVLNADWTHRGGESDHDIAHPALAGQIAPLFEVPIGKGESRSARITADPVVVNGRVYTLDARAGVTAFTAEGRPLWRRDLTPLAERAEDASGGGLATDGARLYVSTGFGEITALDAATGDEVWTQDLQAPGSAAPTVARGKVYAVARDSRAVALDAKTGRILWETTGNEAAAVFDAGAGPAVAGDLAVLPFASGEVLGVFPDGGLRRWSSVVAGKRPGAAAAQAAGGLSGDPVIESGRVYAGNATGRLAAFDAFTGETIWTAADGALSPVVPAGDSLFLVNDLGQLVRLEAATGRPIWRTDLPKGAEGGFLRRDRLFAHYGPVLAGGRLITASSDGMLRQFDPVSGQLMAEQPLPAGAATNPVVAGGVLYVATEAGTLAAFR